MRVLMTSTSYPRDSHDWRGRFIFDMALALAHRGDMELVLWAPPGSLPDGVQHDLSVDDGVWLAHLLERGGIAHLLRNQPASGFFAAVGLLRRLHTLYHRNDAEVVHVNWLQNALPLAGQTPALITVLGSDFGLLRVPGMVPIIRHVLRGRRAILAPNAGWMAKQLQRHFGDIAEVRSIPFGVDKSWFDITRIFKNSRPCHWLAVTRLTRNKLGTLFEWGEGIFGRDHVLHLFGPQQERDIAIPDWVQYHGPTHPQALREEWFPNASGLITLSRHNEGRPQVILEAMAAGLPVVASHLPAHDDVIVHRKTGMLIDSVAGFAEALDFLAVEANNRDIGVAASEWVRTHVGTWDDCAARYVAAYHDLAEGAA